MLETGIKVLDLLTPVREGRQDRPVRRRGVGKTVLIQEMIFRIAHNHQAPRCSPAWGSVRVRATT